VSRFEDSVLELDFGESPGNLFSFGVARVFGSVGVPIAKEAAAAELWKRRVMHSLRPEKSLVSYIGGDSTTIYNSSSLQVGVSKNQLQQYIEEVQRTDETSLLSLLALEIKRIGLGVSQVCFKEKSVLAFVLKSNLV
jgi:hypothetical protein